ncbi:MAG: hypothetical protein QOE70_5728 [Chthoniobacter sp.]|jgi:uncharacterized protein (DUF58 family)|nr:hypothetical protein [Chthoniobacter sp.]
MASDAQPKTKSSAKTPEKDGIAAFLNPAEMHKLGRLVLLSRYTVEGNLAGAHRSPLRGPSSEFADHKSYGQGDDPKHIDWRVLARTDKYFIKRYEDETNLRVYLALDRSASMGYRSGNGPTKFEFACHLAAALGYVIVKARDSVGLFLHDEKVNVRMDAGNSFQHLNNLLKHVQSNPPGAGTDIAQTLHEIAGSVRRRALIVVISDLLGDEAAVNVALAHLRKQRHDVIVFQTLDPAEIDLSFKKACELRDLETGERLAVNPRGLADEYRKVFGAFLEQYQKACAGMNIDYRLVRTDQPLESFVRAYLEERRRLSR